MTSDSVAAWLAIAPVVLIVAGGWLFLRGSLLRKALPRVFELVDLSQSSPSAYFRDFEKSLSEIPQKLKQFRDIDSDLQSLDTTAWRFLKAELQPLLDKKHPTRGWQPLFDTLNQAKGYRYLKDAGFTDIQFVPRSSRNGQQTPDLRANLGVRAVLCEVKTINVSDVEADRRGKGVARSISDQLGELFFGKLAATLASAKQQLVAFDTAGEARRIVFVVFNFDDSLDEYADRYQLQIERHIESSPVANIEVRLDIKPPFYRAMA